MNVARDAASTDEAFSPKNNPDPNSHRAALLGSAAGSFDLGIRAMTIPLAPIQPGGQPQPRRRADNERHGMLVLNVAIRRRV
jgi:hypothetical protein